MACLAFLIAALRLPWNWYTQSERIADREERRARAAQRGEERHQHDFEDREELGCSVRDAMPDMYRARAREADPTTRDRYEAGEVLLNIVESGRRDGSLSAEDVAPICRVLDEYSTRERAEALIPLVQSLGGRARPDLLREDEDELPADRAELGERLR